MNKSPEGLVMKLLLDYVLLAAANLKAKRWRNKFFTAEDLCGCIESTYKMRANLVDVHTACVYRLDTGHFERCRARNLDRFKLTKLGKDFVASADMRPASSRLNPQSVRTPLPFF